jgi:Xaa-Pro aminopeptidase
MLLTIDKHSLRRRSAVSPPVPLMNRLRAQLVLGEFGIDAMLLADPINVYHATGFWPLTLEMGQLGSSLAVVPADASLPVTLVTSQFLYYFADVGVLPPGGPLRATLFTMADEHGAPTPANFFRQARNGPLDPFERATRAATTGLLNERPHLAGPADAVAAALMEIGAVKATATDNYVAQTLLGDVSQSRPAEPLLRRIRMIKSPGEIALMRRAAHDNAEAARAAITSVAIGDSYEALQRAFAVETGKRGGQPVFFIADSNAYAKRDGIIRDGRSFSIDAVGRYDRYHGDFGRTIFVGTPDPALRRAVDAAIAANEAVSQRLGPGLRYTDVMRIGREAIAASGLDVSTPSSPHSVGLFHTDEAFAGDAMTFAKADHLIEEGMTLSVDCPILQTDMAGTVHLEDLWLITAKGCEPLNDTSNPYFQIGV